MLKLVPSLCFDQSRIVPLSPGQTGAKDGVSCTRQHCDYSFDEETREIYGHKIRLDKIYQVTSTLLKIYTEHNHNDDQSSLHGLVQNIQLIF